MNNTEQVLRLALSLFADVVAVGLPAYCAYRIGYMHGQRVNLIDQLKRKAQN